MSYPPTSSHSEYSRRAVEADGVGRSSADHYASVPTHEGVLDEEHAAPLYSGDDQYPMRPDASMGNYRRESDPYGQYGDLAASANPSYANFSEFDQTSHMGLNTYGQSESNMHVAGYSDKYMPDDSRRAEPTASHRALRKGGSAPGSQGFWARLSSRARRFVVFGALAILAVIIIAIAIPAALVSRSNANKSESVENQDGRSTMVNAAPSGVPTGGSDTDWRTASTGADGSTVFMEDGTSFIYNNTFGGFWNAIPFNDSAKAQADMPALNEKWDYSQYRISGVNLGGWLTIEPFIVPGLFEPFNANNDDPDSVNLAIDEWTLCEQLGNNMSTVIEEHYKTFITERDFAQIAGAGLNWIRLPIPYWLIEVYPGEPFLANVGWAYFLKALSWARKYGLRVNLDLHAVPGSQNGYNHSSKQGTINLLNGVMGIANAQRTLNYIRTLTEFISTDQYKNVVPHFSILNEPYSATIGVDTLRHFYLEVYNMVRGITGYGEGNGPWITFHDGFVGSPVRSVAEGGWLDFLPGMDRVALDTHPYLCFSAPNNDGITYQAAKPCSYWATDFNTTQADFGFYMAGEWSLAFNDCGKWLNNVGNGQRFEGTYYQPGNSTPQYERVGSCEPWTDYTSYNQSTKDGLKLVAAGHQDAFRNWFYWTWKTGFSNDLGRIANPVWNYQLGLEQGWMPENPRTVAGACTSLVSQNGFTVSMSPYPAPTLSAWMTGGVGAGTMLNQSMSSQFSAWPPTALGTTPTEFLPTYTPTGTVKTMPVTTPTSYPSGFASTGSVEDGWYQPSDTAGWATPVAGCSYLNPWSGAGAAVPTTQCAGDAVRMRRAPTATRPAIMSTITAKPQQA